MVVVVLPSLESCSTYSVREAKVCIMSRRNHLDIAAQHGVDCVRGCGANSFECTCMLLQ